MRLSAIFLLSLVSAIAIAACTSLKSANKHQFEENSPPPASNENGGNAQINAAVAPSEQQVNSVNPQSDTSPIVQDADESNPVAEDTVYLTENLDQSVGEDVLTGFINGNNGEYVLYKDNPWFLKVGDNDTDTVDYCIEDYRGYTDNFSMERDLAKKYVQEVFDNWKSTLEFYQQKFLQSSLYSIRHNFILQDCYEDIPLRIYLGSNNETIELKRKLKLEYDGGDFISLAVREQYDPVKNNTHGYIWMAPDLGERRYRSISSITKNTMDNFWSDPIRFKMVLTHEIGHIFGFPHNSSIIMGEKFPSLVAQSGPAYTNMLDLGIGSQSIITQTWAHGMDYCGKLYQIAQSTTGSVRLYGETTELKPLPQLEFTTVCLRADFSLYYGFAKADSFYLSFKDESNKILVSYRLDGKSDFTFQYLTGYHPDPENGMQVFPRQYFKYYTESEFKGTLSHDNKQYPILMRKTKAFDQVEMLIFSEGKWETYFLFKPNDYS